MNFCFISYISPIPISSHASYSFTASISNFLWSAATYCGSDWYDLPGMKLIELLGKKCFIHYWDIDKTVRDFPKSALKAKWGILAVEAWFPFRMWLWWALWLLLLRYDILGEIVATDQDRWYVIIKSCLWSYLMVIACQETCEQGD